jgi:ABC-type polysaccharide/polyol phosphate transport system ATPase subunit
MLRIELQNVTKYFRRRSAGAQLLRDLIRGWVAQNESGSSSFVALRGVTFRINDGESVAVVGHNGAGKSTLLNLITGVAPPDRGVIKVAGRIASLLELGAGFHHDLTGYENLDLNAALIGLTEAELRTKKADILDFAGIAEFMTQPLRTYSTGMKMRLAFAIAIHADPDILLIDEVLGVGDQAFQTKCFNKLLEFQQQGKTIVCVSHSAHALMQLCQRALWLDHGELLMDGHIEQVLSAYSGRVVGDPVPPEI